MATLPYINLGCGDRFHPDWINIDLGSADPGIIIWDVTRGIPRPDSSCAAAYHSHLLEHLRRPEVLPFLKECLRVLRPGGVLRLATPDLERITRLYLQKMELAQQGDPAAGADYEWLLLELFDQTVREQGGGAMAEYLRRSAIPNEDFVYARIGEMSRRITATRRQPLESSSPAAPPLRRRIFAKLRHPGRIVRRLMIHLTLTPEDRRALEIGRFRLSGETHHWLYDRYSLSQLLLQAGFTAPAVQGAAQSQIFDWAAFCLDTRPDGTVYKPDSIFMEALKPA